MKKIISLFKRNYEGDRLVYDEIVPGAEWVIAGEGRPTIKYDGTCCLAEDGRIYKRYDRKLSKSASRKKKKNPDFIPGIEHFKPAPPGWIAAELAPDPNTGHWPGWIEVGDGPGDKWHREAWYGTLVNGVSTLQNGTYELVGPKVQGNPYNLHTHHLWKHGGKTFRDFSIDALADDAPRDFDRLKMWFEDHPIEGIVWHHPDGRMVKIKRKDFGLLWPIDQSF